MIDAKHSKHFTSIVGSENIYSDKAHLIAYSYDATREHFDAEEIYLELLKKQKNVSRATVYRSLEALVEQDLVTRLDFGDGRMRFERSKGDDEHHDHLICEECGKVIEFFNLEMEAQQLATCEEHDFTPSVHTMHIFGTCSDCKKNK